MLKVAELTMLYTLILIFASTEYVYSVKQFLNVYLAEPFTCEDFPGCFTRNQFSSMEKGDPNIGPGFKDKFEVVDNKGFNSGSNTPRTDQNLRPYSNMVRINDRGPINDFRTNYNTKPINNQGLNGNHEIHRTINYKEGDRIFKAKFQPHDYVTNHNRISKDLSHVQPSHGFGHDSGLSMHQNTINNHGPSYKSEVSFNLVRGEHLNSSPMPTVTKSHNFKSSQMLQPKSEGHRSSILNHNNSAMNIQQGTFHPNIAKHILPNSQIHHGSLANLGKKISKDQQKPHSVQDGQGHMSQRLKYTQGHYDSPPFIRQDILGDQSDSKQHILQNRQHVIKQNQFNLDKKVRIRQNPTVFGSINGFGNTKGLPGLNNLPVGRMNIGSDSKIHFSHIKGTSKSPRRLANRRVVRTVSVKENLRDPDILKTGKVSKPYNLLKLGNIPITDLSHELLLSGPSDIDGNSSILVKQQHNRSEVKDVYATENDLKTFFLLKSLNDHKPNILSKIGNDSEPAMEPELLLKYGNSSEPDFFLISGNSSTPNQPSKSENNSKIDLLLQYENSGEPDFLSIYRRRSYTDFLLTSGNNSEPNLYRLFGQPGFLLIPGNSSKPDPSNSSEIDFLLQYKNNNKSDFLLTFENSSESDHLPKSDISSDRDYLSEVWKSSKPQLRLEDGNNSVPEFHLTTLNSNETNLLLKSRNPNEPIIFIKSLLGEPYQYSDEVYKSGKQQTNKRVERTTDIISTESRLLKYLLSRLTQNNGQGNSSSIETKLINSLLVGNNRAIDQTVHVSGNGSVPVLLWELMLNVLNQHLKRDNNSTGSNGQTRIGLGLLGSNLFGHLLGEHNSAFGNPNPLGQNLTNIGLSGILTPYINFISKIVSQTGEETLKGLELLRNSTLVQQL